MKKKSNEPNMFAIPECSHIVGLDLSLTGTGFAVMLKDLQPGVTTIPYFGRIDTSKLRGMERLAYIEERVIELFSDCPNPWALVENFSFASKGAALFEMGGLGYIVRLALWKHHIPFTVVAPMTLKKFVTGHGNSDKNLMLKEIFRRFSYDVTDDNIADALGLMEMGRAIQGVGTAKLTQEQLAAVEKVTGKTAVEEPF